MQKRKLNMEINFNQEVKVSKPRSKNGTYTAEFVLALAKTENWQNSGDWRKSNMSSYVTASKQGWLNDVYVALGWKVRQRKAKVEVAVTGSDV
jgi:hypothetical protein